MKFSNSLKSTYSDGNIIVGQDECGVDTCKFAVCHFDKFEFGMLVKVVDFYSTLAYSEQSLRSIKNGRRNFKRNINIKCLLGCAF